MCQWHILIRSVWAHRAGPRHGLARGSCDLSRLAYIEFYERTVCEQAPAVDTDAYIAGHYRWVACR